LSAYNIQNPDFSYGKETAYLIAITTPAGCITVDSLLVKINRLTPSGSIYVFVPNAWSPNSDGHNDYLYPLPANVIQIRYFRVFNRWGQLMFETNSLMQGWDGMYRGQPQPKDVYTWTVEAIMTDGKVRKQSGQAVLMR
jgi:gliding motility-associated-like protein